MYDTKQLINEFSQDEIGCCQKLFTGYWKGHKHGINNYCIISIIIFLSYFCWHLQSKFSNLCNTLSSSGDGPTLTRIFSVQCYDKVRLSFIRLVSKVASKVLAPRPRGRTFEPNQDLRHFYWTIIISFWLMTHSEAS